MIRGGYVYLLQAEGGGPMRIGWTRNPDARLRSHQGSSPLELRLIRVFAAPLRVERMLHNALTPLRVRGSWYSADEVVEECVDLAAAWMVEKADMFKEYEAAASGRGKRRSGARSAGELAA